MKLLLLFPFARFNIQFEMEKNVVNKPDVLDHLMKIFKRIFYSKILTSNGRKIER